MTLHEAKNKESEKRGYTNFEALLNYCFSIQDPSLAFEVLEEAALQAIQSAREEAAPKWISVKDSLPKKPGIKSYEHVPCNVYVPQWGVLMLMWNCEHECWDDESGDDVSSYNSSVTHWMPAPEEPKLTAPGR